MQIYQRIENKKITYDYIILVTKLDDNEIKIKLF